MSVKLNSTGGGSVTLDAPSTASNLTVTLPSASGTLTTTSGSTFADITVTGNSYFATSSGNVGIGTSSPTAIGSSKVVEIGASSGNSAFQLFSVAGALKASMYGNASEASVGSVPAIPLLFKTSDTERMRIASAGNVSIGSPSSDGAMLNVFGAAGYNGTGICSYEVSSGNNARLRIYQDTGVAKYDATYSSGGNAHAWLVGGTERMRIDSSGNVGIGTTNTLANALLNVGQGITARNVSTETPYFQTYNGNAGSNLKIWRIGGGSNGSLTFETVNDAYSSATSRMIIDYGGNLLVGTTARDPVASRVAGTSILGDTKGALYSRGAAWEIGLSVSSGNHMTFYTDNGSANVGAGAISSNGSTTTYGTGSDYRMKDNVQPMSGALDKVMQLNPVTYDWKPEFAGTKIHGQGFIAHELQEIVPDCVTGEKDAVDEEGKPVYQGIDTSFLVATLTKAIQELKAELDELKAKVN